MQQVFFISNCNKKGMLQMSCAHLESLANYFLKFKSTSAAIYSPKYPGLKPHR